MVDKALLLTSARRRRGVVKASITRLEGRIEVLELKRELLHADQLTIRRLLKKIEDQDAKFKKYHFAIVEILEDEEELEKEQSTFDDHDDRIADYIGRLQVLVKDKEDEPRTPSVASTPPLGKQLDRISRKITGVQEDVGSAQTKTEVDRCLLQQLDEQISSLKRDLSSVGERIALLEEDRPDLSNLEDALDKTLFKLSLQIKRLLNNTPSSAPSIPSSSGVKLPRIDVPTFDGNIMNWVVFWEQFEAAIHSKHQLSNADKLTYLRHALKEGAARHVIEGLSQAGDNYPEAIDCLRKRYDRPRLIHRAHVQAILNASPLKTGSGKELRRLHDTVNQHLRALKAMEYDPSGPFITSILELKLTEDILFKWQRHSHESGKVPHYQDMLDFLDLRAQSTESVEYKIERKGNPAQHRASYVTSTDNTCVACRKGKHPLYTCQVFKLLPHERQVSILKGNGYCFNCLNKGHISKQCPSSQRCRKCSMQHHTWIHIEPDPDTRKPAKEPSKAVTSHTSQVASPHQQVLLMTCQLRIVTTSGYVTKARALLDSASSTSFITERLAQHLRLPRSPRALQISGIGGVDTHLSSRGSCASIIPT